MDILDHQDSRYFDSHALASYLPKQMMQVEAEDEEREGNDREIRREMKEEEEYSRGSSQKRMSEEEARIRGELEMEIERELEGEIKDEIYRLALRLHRLYQHQDQNYSEINISIKIKMEGGTKLEINETKKKPSSSDRVILDHATPKYYKRRLCIENVHHHHHARSLKNGNSKSKRFDWATSLRSGPPKNSNYLVVRNIDKQKQANGKEQTSMTMLKSTGNNKRANKSKSERLTWK